MSTLDSQTISRNYDSYNKRTHYGFVVDFKLMFWRKNTSSAFAGIVWWTELHETVQLSLSGVSIDKLFMF